MSEFVLQFSRALPPKRTEHRQSLFVVIISLTSFAVPRESPGRVVLIDIMIALVPPGALQRRRPVLFRRQPAVAGRAGPSDRCRIGVGSVSDQCPRQRD